MVTVKVTLTSSTIHPLDLLAQTQARRVDIEDQYCVSISTVLPKRRFNIVLPDLIPDLMLVYSLFA